MTVNEERAGRLSSKTLRWPALALAALGALLAAIGVAAATWVVATVARARIRRRRQEQAGRAPARPAVEIGLQGLSEAEAAARRKEGQDNALLWVRPLSRRAIVRANTLTIFNLSLVGLFVVQVLLDKPWNALLTVVVLALNIGLKVWRAFWVRNNLQELERSTQPQATVIRGGTARSVDASEVVRGDVLVVGPGDQVLADGPLVAGSLHGPLRALVVDESMLAGSPAGDPVSAGGRQQVRRAGDWLYAGSFCLAGYAAHEAQQVGDGRRVVSLLGGPQSADPKAAGHGLTPLERMMDRLLRIMLVVVALLILLLFSAYADLQLPALYQDAVASAAGVIFGLAPAGLFLMILANYTKGALDLARAGALVRRSRSVESLAQTTVVCLAQAGVLTGIGLEVEMLEPPRATGDGDDLPPPIGPSRMRQILGDYARSTSASGAIPEAMQAALPGDRRQAREQAPFLSLYGWSAVAFDDADLRGVYVLGDPGVLEAHLIRTEEEPQDPQDAQGGEPAPGVRGAWRKRIAGVAQRVRRMVTRSQAEGTEAGVEPPPASPVPAPDGRQDMEPVADAKGAPDGGRVRRLAKRARTLLDRIKVGKSPDSAGAREADAQEEDGKDADLPDVQEIVYLVAYRPELVPLHAADGTPRLPKDLIPLCRLRYSSQVRPEAVEAVRALAGTGVEVKVFSARGARAVEQADAVLEQARRGEDDRGPPDTITGPELAALDDGSLARAVADNAIFGRTTPEQEARVVSALRERGEMVMVLGDGVNDLPAMRRANLAVALQSGSPAARSVADVVLLDDSPQALPRVLDGGQRIVNSLLDILKLHLVKLLALLLLILAIGGAGLGFPYRGSQGGLITFVSVVLPSLGFLLWALPGRVPRARLGRRLAWFVCPAGVSIALVGFVVYAAYYERTRDLAYAQLMLTYTLTVSGLALVVLIRPPIRRTAGALPAHGPGEKWIGDWRPTLLALVLLILVLASAPSPLIEWIFGITPLQRAADYGVVGVAVLAWVLAVRLFWWAASLVQRYRAPAVPPNSDE
jgi:magnesium-transporting ATPase (P-type)